jgi:hypothetical protein
MLSCVSARSYLRGNDWRRSSLSVRPDNAPAFSLLAPGRPTKDRLTLPTRLKPTALDTPPSTPSSFVLQKSRNSKKKVWLSFNGGTDASACY